MPGSWREKTSQKRSSRDITREQERGWEASFERMARRNSCRGGCCGVDDRAGIRADAAHASVYLCNFTDSSLCISNGRYQSLMFVVQSYESLLHGQHVSGLLSDHAGRCSQWIRSLSTMRSYPQPQGKMVPTRVNLFSRQEKIARRTCHRPKAQHHAYR